MPQTPERLKLINGLEQRYEDAKRRFLFHNAIREDSDISDDGELGHLSYIDLMRSSELLDATQRSRYIFTRTYRRSTDFILEMDLEVVSDQPKWLNGEDFLSKYRVTRDQLDLITGLISGAEVLKIKSRGPKQMAAKQQLMTYLHFVGHEAMTDKIQRQVFLISRGNCIRP